MNLKTIQDKSTLLFHKKNWLYSIITTPVFEQDTNITSANVVSYNFNIIPHDAFKRNTSITKNIEEKYFLEITL